jgi:predicted RNase H-like nuclease (RuvC/YqgF family)
MHDKLCKTAQVSEVEHQPVRSSDTADQSQVLLGKVEALEHQVTGLQIPVSTLNNQNSLLCRNLTSLQDKYERELASLKVAIKKDREALEKEVISLRDKTVVMCQDN